MRILYQLTSVAELGVARHVEQRLFDVTRLLRCTIPTRPAGTSSVESSRG
jgi:hypothetical protein